MIAVEMRPWAKYLMDTKPELFKECMETIETMRESKDKEAEVLRGLVAGLRSERRSFVDFFEMLDKLLEESRLRRGL